MQAPWPRAAACQRANLESDSRIERSVHSANVQDTGDRPVCHLYTSRRFSPIRVDSSSPDDDQPPTDEQLYEVRIIDNDYNTYQEVMDIAMLALQVSEQEAYAIAWEVDHKGSCAVAYGPESDAEAIASIIRIIGIEVQVNPIGSSWGRPS